MTAPVTPPALPARAFCLIRHGETDANRDKIIAGTIEAMLTEAGRAAACRLAGHDWGQPIALFSSPQQRARDTAALAFPDLRPRIIAGLRERDWGVFEGLPTSQLPARDAPADGWEDWPAMIARVGDAITQAQQAAGGDLPVMVAHSGVIRAARVLTGGAAYGPSPANATPILFVPTDTGWREEFLI